MARQGPNEEQGRNALDLARWRRPHVITGLDDLAAGMVCLPPSRYCWKGSSESIDAIMTLATTLLIALGLAMDSFSVSVCSGALNGRVDVRQALRVGFTMGGFQALMPAIGWVGASLLAGYVENVDHWIAFGLLAVIGGKMLWEALRGDGKCEFLSLDSWRVLALLGLATSIDALAVGISLAFLGVGIAVPAAVIGVVCLVLSVAGVYLGRRAGDWLREWTPAVGGVVLISIGIRILIEHLSVAAT